LSKRLGEKQPLKFVSAKNYQILIRGKGRGNNMRSKVFVLSLLIICFGLVSNVSALENENALKYQAEKKDPLIAGIGAWFLPTLGHHYSGDWGRGLTFFGQELGCIGAVGVGTIWGRSDLGFPMFGIGMNFGLSGMVGLAAIKIMEIYDAVLTADEQNKLLDERLRISGDQNSSLPKYYLEAKNSRVAAGYAILLPSSGHYYAGDWGRGLDYLWKEALLLCLPAVWKDGVIFGVVGAVFMRFAEIGDAASTAEEYNAELRSNYGIKE
jgi:hypothetical protein